MKRNFRSKIELGQKFDRWTILSEYGKNENGHTYWICKCRCGTISNIHNGALYDGTSKSCGCLKHELEKERYKKPLGEAARNGLFRRYKYQANNRNLIFELSLEECILLFGNNCFYCGSLPKSIFSVPHYNGDFIYNGIDRLDNSKGYTKDNVVSCCKHCNFAKGYRLSKEQFLELAFKIYRNHNK